MIDEEDIGTELSKEVTVEAEPDEEDFSSGGKRVSEEIWAEIEERYAVGTHKMDQLSREYGVSRQSISRRMKKQKISFGCRAHVLKAGVTAAVVASTAAATIRTFVEQRATWVEETRVESYNALKFSRGLASKIVKDCLRASHPMASISEELKVVQRFQKILIDNALTSLEILNADAFLDEATIPVLTLRDITDQEIEAIQRGEPDSDDEEVAEDLLEAMEAMLPDA